MSTDTAETQMPPRRQGMRGAHAQPVTTETPVIELRVDGTTGLVDSRTLAPLVAPTWDVGTQELAQPEVVVEAPPAMPVIAPPTPRMAGLLALGVLAPFGVPAIALALPLSEAAQGGVLVGSWTLLAVIARGIAEHDGRRPG